MSTIQQFGDTKDVQGKLLIGDKMVERCTVRLHYNRYDLNSMEVELFDLRPLDPLDYAEDRSFEKVGALDVEVRSSAGNSTSQIILKPAQLFSQTHQGRVRADVEEYHHVQDLESPEDTERVSVSYLFPLTSVTRSRSMTTKDSRFGFYRGKLDRDNEKIDVSRDTLNLNTENVQVKLAERFGIHEMERRSLYPIVGLVRHSTCFLESTCKEGDYKPVLDNIEHEAEIILRLLSVVEQDRINWSIKRAVFFDGDNNLISLRKRFRWAPPPSDSYRTTNFASGDPRDTLVKLFDGFSDLKESETEDVRRAIENYKRASCANTVETKLVIWHSFLDQIMDELYGISDGPFSAKVVKVADKCGLDISDLFEVEVIDYWKDHHNDKSRSCFWFVDARNRFIHDGLGALLEEGRRAAEAVRNVRAFTERLLLHKLGVEHRGTSLGSPTF